MYFFSQIPSTGESPAGDAKRLRIQDRQKKVESKLKIINLQVQLNFLIIFPNSKILRRVTLFNQTRQFYQYYLSRIPVCCAIIPSCRKINDVRVNFQRQPVML